MKRAELMARAKPVLFNTEMVTAILEGRKTQTRRAIKPPREYVGCVDYINGIGKTVRAVSMSNGGVVVAPYQAGDILYVRETWTRFSCDNCKADAIGMCLHKLSQTEQDDIKGCYEYKAGYPEGEGVVWHPSIHMPKAAARLFLRVTDVRAERLQDITVRGVLAEGVERKELSPSGCRCAWQTEGCKDEPCGNRAAYERACHVTPFAALWDSTVKKRIAPCKAGMPTRGCGCMSLKGWCRREYRRHHALSIVRYREEDALHHVHTPQKAPLRWGEQEAAKALPVFYLPQFCAVLWKG